MTRSRFFAFALGLIPGLAKAQLPTGHRQAANVANRMLVPWEEERPKPNQCPACTRMAKPFKPRAKDYPGCRPPHDCQPWDKLPTVNLVRCYHCNSAFYQDAE